MTILPDTNDIHEAIRRWGVEYGAALRQALDIDGDDLDFQAFVESAPDEWANDGLFVRLMWAERTVTPPAWPSAATPLWAVDVEIDGVRGGAVGVEFTGRFHTTGEASAYLCASGSVFVTPIHARREPGMSEVGDHVFDDAFTFGWQGPEPLDGAAISAIEDLAAALRAVAAEAREISLLQGLSGADS